MKETGEELKITTKKIRKIINDPEKTAGAAHLVYVNDSSHGITRRKKNNSFEYLSGEKKIEDENELKRIKALAIPPAWENVWICKLSNGHLQATGTDMKNRKQYRYHPLWNKLRNHTKYYHMHDFGKNLPAIREKLENDISLKGLPQEKILAAIVSLMENTNIRIGNNFYEKLYGSFGLTTLKEKHVKINGSQLKFSFKGKKGVVHDITFKNKRIAAIVQQCKDIPGKELFHYYDENKEKKMVDSGMVNNYIKTISGSDFTAKDFRTWAGSVNALQALKGFGCTETEAEKKKNILAALDSTAKQLGNTRNVCRKYYVNPIILSLYENDKLNKYMVEQDKAGNRDSRSFMTTEENILMKILENDQRTSSII